MRRRLDGALRDCGQTAADLCRMFDLHLSHFYGLNAGRLSPVRKDGGFTYTARAICAAMGVSPCDIWPEHAAPAMAEAPHPDTPERELQRAELARDIRAAISTLRRSNPIRERRLMLACVELGSYADAARALGVSREAVRQSCKKALRSMREGAHGLSLASHVDAIGAHADGEAREHIRSIKFTADQVRYIEKRWGKEAARRRREHAVAMANARLARARGRWDPDAG